LGGGKKEKIGTIVVFEESFSWVMPTSQGAQGDERKARGKEEKKTLERNGKKGGTFQNRIGRRGKMQEKIYMSLSLMEKQTGRNKKQGSQSFFEPLRNDCFEVGGKGVNKKCGDKLKRKSIIQLDNGHVFPFEPISLKGPGQTNKRVSPKPRKKKI